VIIARTYGSRLTLSSRRGTNFTDSLPMIAEAVCSLAAQSALIEGEAVVFRPDGRSDFAAFRTKGAQPGLLCIRQDRDHPAGRAIAFAGSTHRNSAFLIVFLPLV
jgi:hypothetical protein